MPKHIQLTLLALTICTLTACGGSTTIHQTWKNPNIPYQAEHILVIALSKEQAPRVLFEGAVADNLAAVGAKGTPSFSSLGNENKPDKEEIIAIATRLGVDSVLVATVHDFRQEKEAISSISRDGGNAYQGYRTGSNRHGWYNNYQTGTTTVRSYTQEYAIANIETNLYDLDSEEMIWSAISETVAVEGGSKEIAELAKVLVKALKKDGLI